MELRRDLINIRSDDVDRPSDCPAVLEVLALDDVADFLDGFAVQGAGSAHGLEAIVLGWIVTACDHDGAVGFGVLRRIVKHRRRDRADIGDVASDVEQPFHQRSRGGGKSSAGNRGRR